MLDINPMLLCDTYKTVHNMMYPYNLEKLVSYWVPRKSMFQKPENQKMVWFGVQSFVQEYLVDYFNKNFFQQDYDTIVQTYKTTMDIQLDGYYTIDHIIELYQLGYLPLKINVLPEGSKVNMGVPCIELQNTVKGFAWVVQWVECLLQCELWKICNDATIGHIYHNLAKEWYNKTVDNNVSVYDAFANFDMRGADNIESATRTGAAWLLSSNKTSTIPSLPYINKYYLADLECNKIGVGGISTEHSVISSNTAVGMDEEKLLKKFLTETFVDKSFSFLGDTYDYWNFIDNVIPNCKNEILNHNGKLLIRPDSGDMIEISINTIQKLWEIFGGTINSKGYKVLNPKIGLIYGDGCTVNQLKKIWSKLEELGFAANNIVFGIGAFCFKVFFEDDKMIVNTRDTFGCAMKSTYGIVDGKEIFIHKAPKTDNNNLKTSHKGLVFVEKTNDGFKATDSLTQEQYNEYKKTHQNAMATIFVDGVTSNFESFETIRNRLNK